MFDELSQDIKRAAGPTDTSASFDPIWLRANQMQRRRAAFFSLAAASVSIVAVMGVGAIRSAEPVTADPVAFPSESLDKQMVTVPNVVGMPVPHATKILRAEGLQGEFDMTIDCNPFTIEVKGKKDRDVTIDVEQIEVTPKNRRKPTIAYCMVNRPTLVDRQFPPAGSEVEEGSVIELTSKSKRFVIRSRVGRMNEEDG